MSRIVIVMLTYHGHQAVEKLLDSRKGFRYVQLMNKELFALKRRNSWLPGLRPATKYILRVMREWLVI
jgi:hypothetical protein